MAPEDGRAEADGVAHDLRNLLTAVLAHAELAQAALAPDHPARADVADLVIAATRARRLVLDRLIPEGADPVPPERTDLAEVAAAALPILRAVLPVEARVLTALAPAGPVRIDRLALERILLNLVLNASAAVGSGGTVRIATTNAGDGSPELSVTDDGPGLPDAGVAILAGDEPAVGGGADGHGLGLPTVRRLADADGARILVERIAGGGTTIRLRYPRA